MESQTILWILKEFKYNIKKKFFTEKSTADSHMRDVTSYRPR